MIQDMINSDNMNSTESTISNIFKTNVYRNKQESDLFYLVQLDEKVKILLSSTLPPPYFLSPFFKTFVTHPPKINELDNVVTPTPVLRP